MTTVTNIAGLVGPRATGVTSGTVGPAAAIGDGTTIEDASRYRTIESGLAFGIAVMAAIVVTGLLRIVL
ncbi:hypothetical protein ACQVP2_13245 [Methylobacterium aquaticum]|uniref:hypothetical protein n=1 Tax=Methylobacterium aquaticum TaxID=270351 RepID=UPI003D16812D